MRLISATTASLRNTELWQRFCTLGKTTMLGILMSVALNAIVLVPSQAQQQAVPPNSPAVPSDEGPPPVSPPVQQIVPATTRSAALQQARTTVGKHNPFEPITDFKPFPRGATEIIRPGQKHSSQLVPTKASLPPHERLVPPPPPGLGTSLTSSPSQQDLLSPNELPQPPEKPALSPKLTLCGILGNRALFTFTDQLERFQNKWPFCISLATGEKFESVSVVDITPDTVTLEEDGEREVKQLQRIR